MMTFINKKPLGIYAPGSNQQSHLAAQAGYTFRKTFYEFKKLYFGTRQIAWKHRNAGGIFWEALQNGELDEFKLAPGHRNADGTYSKDEWHKDALNAYLWQRFCTIWEEGMSLEKAQNLHSYKDLKQFEQELLQFVYENWGEKLLANYIPVADSLSEVGKFQYELDNITVKGKFTKTKREIILTGIGCPEVLVIQNKGEKSWTGGIHCDTWGQPITMNAHQAQIFGEMMSLAGRLNIGIKDFMKDPEGFLGLESAKQRNQLLRHLKQVIIQMNDDYLAKLNERKKKEAEHQRQLNEVTTGEEDQPFEPEVEQPEETEQPQETPTKPSLQIVKIKKKSKKEREKDAQAWLEAHPEFAKDLDEELGLSEIDTPEDELA